MPDALPFLLPALLHGPRGCLHHEDPHVQQRPGPGEAGCGHHCQVSGQPPSQRGVAPTPDCSLLGEPGRSTGVQPGPTLHSLPQALWRGAWPLRTSVYLSVKRRGLPSEGIPILAFLRGYQRSEGSPPLPSSVRTGLGEEGCQELPVAREPLGPRGLPWSLTLALPSAPHCCVCWCPQGKQDQRGGPGMVQGGLSAPRGGLHGGPSRVRPSTRPGRIVSSGPPFSCRYLDNICLHPEEEKYRKIKLQNRVFQVRLPAAGCGQATRAHHAHACTHTPYTSTHIRMQAPAHMHTHARAWRPWAV